MDLSRTHRTRVAQGPEDPDVSEEHVQFVVARVLDAAGVLWCHVPNGQLRDPVVAGKLVAAGVKAGVPDVLIFDSFDRNYALELKRVGGRLSPDQARWIAELERRGWRVAVAHGTTEALAQLDRWDIDVTKALERIETTLGYRLVGGRLQKAKNPRNRTRAAKPEGA